MRSSKQSALSKINEWAKILSEKNNASKKKIKPRKLNFPEENISPSAPSISDFTKSTDTLNLDFQPPYSRQTSESSEEEFQDTINNLDLSTTEKPTNSEFLIALIDNHKKIMTTFDSLQKDVFKRIPTLSTDRSTADQFLKCTQHIIDQIDSSSKKLEMIHFILDHKTSPSAYQKLKNVVFSSTEEFKTKLLATLFPNDIVETLQAKLTSIIQRDNESNVDYIDRFKSELTKLDDIIEADVKKSQYYTNNIKKTFVNNLNQKTRILATMKIDNSLDDIINFIISNADIKLNQNETLEDKLDRVLTMTQDKDNKQKSSQHQSDNSYQKNSYQQKKFRYKNHFNSHNYRPIHPMNHRYPYYQYNYHNNAKNGNMNHQNYYPSYNTPRPFYNSVRPTYFRQNNAYQNPRSQNFHTTRPQIHRG